MFEIIQRRNEKKEKSLLAIEDVLAKAESNLEELDRALTEALNNGDIDKYSQIMNDRNIRETFVEKTREKVKELKAKPAYYIEDLEAIKVALQRKYNPALEKAHKTLRDNLSKVIKSFEESQRINDEFINERIDLYILANQIDNVVNVYEGDSIKNDIAEKYLHTIISAKNSLENNELQ